MDCKLIRAVPAEWRHCITKLRPTSPTTCPQGPSTRSARPSTREDRRTTQEVCGATCDMFSSVLGHWSEVKKTIFYTNQNRYTTSDWPTDATMQSGWLNVSLAIDQPQQLTNRLLGHSDWPTVPQLQANVQDKNLQGAADPSITSVPDCGQWLPPSTAQATGPDLRKLVQRKAASTSTSKKLLKLEHPPHPM